MMIKETKKGRRHSKKIFLPLSPPAKNKTASAGTVLFVSEVADWLRGG
jgi:hypothetical protein